MHMGGGDTRGPLKASTCLNAHAGGRYDFDSETLVTTAVSVALRGREGGGMIEMGDDVAHALRASQGGGDKPHVLAPTAYRTSPNCGAWETGDRVDALTTGTDPTSHIIQQRMAVRRLLPTECLKLQSFPPDYFDNVISKGKLLADGTRYKMAGNSWNIATVRWIFSRINEQWCANAC